MHEDMLAEIQSSAGFCDFDMATEGWVDLSIWKPAAVSTELEYESTSVVTSSSGAEIYSAPSTTSTQVG